MGNSELRANRRGFTKGDRRAANYTFYTNYCVEYFDWNFEQPKAKMLSQFRRNEMNVNIETSGFALTPAMRLWVDQQIAMTFRQLEGDVRGVDVRLSHTEDRDGVSGRLAAFNVYLKHRSPIRLTTVHANLYSAIAISAQRSALAVGKAVTTRRRSVRADMRRWRHQSMVSAPI